MQSLASVKTFMYHVIENRTHSRASSNIQLRDTFVYHHNTYKIVKHTIAFGNSNIDLSTAPQLSSYGTQTALYKYFLQTLFILGSMASKLIQRT